ncbi:MAG: amidohydrolase family protein [Pseudomonadota bacterium]
MNLLTFKRIAVSFFAASLALMSVAAADVTVIHAGRLIDPFTEQTLVDQYISVEEGVITGVSGGRPAGDTFIDLADMTVLPGLMDGHVHITRRHDIQGLRRVQFYTAAMSGVLGAENARKTLMAGFTTIRNLGAPAYSDVDLRDAINAGHAIGPRILAAGPSLGITGGHCDSNYLPFKYNERNDGVADGPWAVRQKVRQNNKYGVDLIKYCATGGVVSKGTDVGARQYTQEEMDALVDEAHTLGLKVAAHAHGTGGILAALRAGVDSIEHASFLSDEAIRLAKKNGTVFSMDIYVTDFILSQGEAMGFLEESLEKERTVGRRQRENFRKAYEAGVKMGFGTDASLFPHGQNARQFAIMVEWGMSPMDAIKAATTTTAELLGIAEQTGRITPGLAADIIAVNGDPLEDIRTLEAVEFVMKDGVVYKN